MGDGKLSGAGGQGLFCTRPTSSQATYSALTISYPSSYGWQIGDLQDTDEALAGKMWLQLVLGHALPRSAPKSSELLPFSLFT